MTFFYGFMDELVKLSKLSDEDAAIKNIATGAGAVGGAIPGGLLGTLAAGKGRRGKGALIGALLGGLATGAISRSQASELLKMQKSAGTKEDIESLADPKGSAAKGATRLGGFGALLGLLAGGKGKRLKRALFGGAAGAGIGGLGGLGLGSKSGLNMIKMEKESPGIIAAIKEMTQSKS